MIPNDTENPFENENTPQSCQNGIINSSFENGVSRDDPPGLETGQIPRVVKESYPAETALSVINAYKSFEPGQPVLRSLNMTVQAGTIYSLLGSSGCGKTTLLSCCVGLSRLDSGDIRIFGKIPGTPECGVPGRQVGYMPQELSLYDEFSIEESLQYFGRLYGMSKDKICSEMKFLIHLLNLPNPSRRINTLSGGQKRRVSFAIGVFHNAPLLIMDEPTVGVDPLLRESIWDYLIKLVIRHKTTVIITTHYIEEARQSNTVGFMRNGRLLVEKSPDALLSSFGFPLLEQVVLHLCKQDIVDDLVTYDIASLNVFKQNDELDKGQDVMALKYRCTLSSKDEPTREHKNLQTSDPYVPNIHKDFCEMFNRLKALTLKNFVVLFRNIWFLLFVFLVPPTQIMLICLAIGPDPKHLNLGVVNHEVNDSSKICEPSTGCEWMDLSCRYLDKLPKQSFNLIPYEHDDDALRDIRTGQLWGYLSIPENYSSFMMDRAASGAYSSNETFDGSRITFEMDMSNKQIGQTMKKIFFDVFQTFISDFSKECETNSRQTELPLYFKTPVYGTDDTSFSEFLAPSVLLGLLFFFPLCSSGIACITEKKTGTLDRSLVAGVTNAEIMTAYLVSQSFVLVAQSGLAFLILTVVFQIPIKGSIVWAIILAILIGIGGMSMGFLISTICTEEIHAVLLAIGAFFPNFILAGMVWPIQGMPIILQYVGYLLPCTLACESMRAIVSRGWGVTHPDVWPGFVSTIAWICVYWTLTILLNHFSHKK